MAYSNVPVRGNAVLRQLQTGNMRFQAALRAVLGQPDDPGIPPGADAEALRDAVGEPELRVTPAASKTPMLPLPIDEFTRPFATDTAGNTYPFPRVSTMPSAVI